MTSAGGTQTCVAGAKMGAPATREWRKKRLKLSFPLPGSALFLMFSTSEDALVTQTSFK